MSLESVCLCVCVVCDCMPRCLFFFIDQMVGGCIKQSNDAVAAMTDHATVAPDKQPTLSGKKEDEIPFQLSPK